MTAIGLAVLLVGAPSAASATRAFALPAGLSVANLSAWHGHGDLAFISEGRLMVLDGADDSIRVLSTSVAGVTSPTFSPNGRWLLYGSAAGSWWLSRSNGSYPHRLSASTATWLPTGRLLVGDSIVSIGENGTPHTQRAAPAGLEGWSANGSAYVFASDTLNVDYPHPSTGIERLETATSLGGQRTLWHEERQSFTEGAGLHGDFLTVEAVLPRGSGLLVLDDVDHSDQADGQALDLIRHPGGTLTRLATVLAASAGGSVRESPSGELAIGAGGDRYAWAKKGVVVCTSTATNCHALAAPSGTSTIDPAWSPAGSRLAVIEAIDEPASSIGQQAVAGWYRTHRLAILEPAEKHLTTIPGTTGAAAPSWSSDGKTLMYVADDGLWLVAADDSRPPTEIVAPLFAPGAWPSYYGEVDWTDQFSWTG